MLAFELFAASQAVAHMSRNVSLSVFPAKALVIDWLEVSPLGSTSDFWNELAVPDFETEYVVPRNV